MAPVGMMETTRDQIVDVIPMRYRFVTATWSVYMIRLVMGLRGDRETLRRILIRNGDTVLVIVTTVRVMKMTVVQIVNMVVMFNGRVAAAGAVLMEMGGVFVTGHG